MGVNNGYDIGVNGRDLILKTSGKIYVKVADKFYELNFRNEDQNSQKTESAESQGAKASDVVLLNTLSTENYPGDNKIVINNDELYITKGGFYKKMNVATPSQSEDVATSHQFVETSNDSETKLFVNIEDNVWGLGETMLSYDGEFVTDPPIKWNDYLFFNSVRSYFFESVSNIDDDDEIDKLFFNTIGTDRIKWTTKTLNEIKNAILKIEIDGKPATTNDFKELYDHFWYTESNFNNTISEYHGLYATFVVKKWTKSLSPGSQISVDGHSAIVTAIIDDSVIIKFKDKDITPNLSNLRKTAGSIVVYENKEIAFIDVLRSDLNVYKNALQTEDDILVRIGSLDTLAGYSGVGAVFNGNVSIKNGPFTLNSDGSGNIGPDLNWDKDGMLFGNLIDRLVTVEEWIKENSNTST